MAGPAHLLLIVAVLPPWVLAGLADWACHRASHIATTSGLRENVLHWIMFVEVGGAVLAMALLEIDAAVLLIVAAAFVLHEATVWIDLHTTLPLRRVSALEQMVHSVQEIFPLLALALLAVAAWDQALALLGLGHAAPDWRLRGKEQPLPAWLLAAGALAVAACNVLPLAQESWACLRARRRR